MTQPGGNTRRGHLGRFGEDLASAFLQRLGYDILERNWRCARGELDIIARSGHTLVFVEVKTRASVRFGHPLESVTERKLSRIRSLALMWRQVHPHESGLMRVDVVAVLAPAGAPYVIEHLMDVAS